MAGADQARAITTVDVQVAETVVVEVLVPGPQGARGPSGGEVLVLPIRGASSFTANHPFAYAPRAWLLDAASVEVETDIVHAPGQVTAIFPVPFTGTLYLG